MSFIHPDFLLQSAPARRLYHEFAACEPILDYHNHLPPRDIARDRQFADLSAIWLEGDHYKWRALRADGVPESFITGEAAPYEKFLAWAKTVPHTLRNPLFHWTHLELERYFGIDELLNEKSAPRIWHEANAQLAQPENGARGLLKRFDVRALCTTDDPADSLDFHRQIAASGCATRVYPTFRPDHAMNVGAPGYNAWLDRLAAICDREIRVLPDLLEALQKRHDDFHAVGGRLSDHGLARVPAQFASEEEAAQTFHRARAGQIVSAEAREKFAGFLLLFFGRLDAAKGWTKQLHLGARRNNNSRMFERLGPDTGFDSIGDFSQVDALANYLDRLDRDDALPQIVLYNLNPADNYALATLAGNFQRDVPGKIQFGSGWWFLDQKEAMRWQLNALSNNGLLWNFIGMLTDSRSFMSFPRHEYFRRVLCDLIGNDIVRGELPADYQLVGTMVKNICYGNARDYLRLHI